MRIPGCLPVIVHTTSAMQTYGLHLASNGGDEQTHCENRANIQL